MFTNKISQKWRNLLENDADTTYQGEWIGFYFDGGEDPTSILQCGFDFAPPCMQLHHLSMPLPMQCFTMGAHSCRLREWEKMKGR